MYNVENMDVVWMRYAIVLAKCASSLFGEVSVGAVLVRNGMLVGYGWNSSITFCDPSAHAEIMALRMGGLIVNNYRLLGTTLYVTLEPCMMCIGAIIHARVFRLVCGAKSKKFEWTVWFENILKYPMINHHIILTVGILEKECSKLLKNFFKYRRCKSGYYI